MVAHVETVILQRIHTAIYIHSTHKDGVGVRIPGSQPNIALVGQLVESTALEVVQCRFESDQGYQLLGCLQQIFIFNPNQWSGSIPASSVMAAHRSIRENSILYFLTI